MNRVILIGRLTRDAETRYSGETAVSKYTLAVNKKGNNQEADFISCVCFGKQAEFADKYLRKGTKIAITGRIQAGSYIDKDGRKVFATDVIVEDAEFCESKQSNEPAARNNSNGDGWMNIPDGIPDELPFN